MSVSFAEIRESSPTVFDQGCGTRVVLDHIMSKWGVLVLSCLSDGTRRVTQVSEVQGMEGDSVIMQDIFEFEQTGIQNGRVMGQLKSTGLRPKFSEKFLANGIELPAHIFEA